MDDAVSATLKALLTPALRDELLDDPRRLAELVRERLGTDRRREASFLNAVMQEGVPKRLLAMPAGSLTTAMIANYARKVSEDSGLREDVARSAIDVWSVGLGLSAGVSVQADAAARPELSQMAGAPEGGKHPAIVFDSADTREMRGSGFLIIIFGVAAMLLSSLFSRTGTVLGQALPIFTMAAASIYAGVALVLISYSPPAAEFKGGGLGATTPLRRVLGIAMVVCAIDAIALCLYLTAIFADLGVSASLHSWDILPLTVLVGTAILFPAIIFRLYRRSAPTPVAATLNLLDPVAIILLVRGLFGFWMFDMNLDGDRSLGWLRPELPFDLAMILISVAILVGSPRLVHKAVIAAICSVSVIFQVCDLRLLSGTGTRWEWKMLDEIGIIVDLLVLGLLLFSYMRHRNTAAQAA